MKTKMRKTLSLFLVSIMLFACFPLRAHALPSNLEIDSKSVSLEEAPRTPADLSDGELYTYSSAEAAALPSTDFTITLSALGQQYKTTTITTQRFNIAFVLDVSNSMDDTRITNMVGSANAAIETLSGSENKIAVVSFATTPVVERGLFEKGLTLSRTGSTNTSGAIDTIYINRRSDYYQGGTNIQGGLNAAYKLLRDENDPEAIPVIILLSDGAPTYYYQNVTGFKSTGSDLEGNGGSTYNNHVAYTVMQAAYLKTQMTNLQIYTIPFSIGSNDSAYKMATATLNPTSGNINAVSGLLSTLNSIKGSLSTTVQNAIVYNYPDGSYSASNSSTSLASALNNIISNMKLNKPIAETMVSGVLNAASYVALTYTIGDGYTLSGSTMTVTLVGTSYEFTKHISGAYTYDVPNTAVDYNPEMAKAVITLSEKTLIWKTPASILPCNTPEGTDQVLASPISLRFVVCIDDAYAGLSAGTYLTSSSCTAAFTPTSNNPFYYTSDATAETVATNTITTAQQTEYYEATYPYPGHDNYNRDGNGLPVLTGFGVGDSASAITYRSNSSAISVTNYYDNRDDDRDTMSILYDGRTIGFQDIYYKSATVSFNTTDKSDPSKYEVTYFNDGYRTYTDAAVTAISGDDITVSYNGGFKTIVFKNVQFSSGYYYAYFRSYDGRNPDPSSLSNVSIIRFEIGNTQINSGYAIKSIEKTSNYYTSRNGTVYYYYNIVVTYDGIDYNYDNFLFNVTDYGWYDSGWETASQTLYTANNKSQPYYYAATSDTFDVTTTIENFRFMYDPTTHILWVSTKQPNGSFATYGSYTADANTVIAPTSDGYTVTQTTIGGAVKTVDIITMKSTELTRQRYRSTARNGLSIASGIVTKSLSNTGIITLQFSLTPQECVPSAKLESLAGSNTTTANSSGVAYVVLTLTVAKSIHDPQITLENTADTSKSGFTYLMTNAVNTSAPGVSILVGGTLPSTLAPGEYKITYKTEITYTNKADKPKEYYVNFDHMSFMVDNLFTPLTLSHAADYTDQQVKVVLVTPSGH